ncbi:MAG: hypothetical protein NC926_01855 [Candidatus Omnitrophica bacterium]|nr:hypothetical protein [Candidatus Omnitrophota bacterium]
MQFRKIKDFANLLLLKLKKLMLKKVTFTNFYKKSIVSFILCEVCPVLCLILLGIAVRIHLMKGLKPLLYPDSYSYIEPALRLLKGGNIASTIRPPFYPFFLFVIYFFSGAENNWAVIMIQHLIGILTYILYYYLLLEVISNRIFAFLFSAFASLNMYFICFEQTILTETLVHFLLIYFLLIFLKYAKPKNLKKRWLFFYLILLQTLLILTKPFFLFFPILIGIWLIILWRIHKFPKTFLLSRLTIFFIFSILPIIAWQTVNYKVYGIYTYSLIKNINLLVKILQTNQYIYAPSKMHHVTQVISEMSSYSQYEVANILLYKEIPTYRTIRTITNYCVFSILNAPVHYIKENLKLIPMIFDAKAIYYLDAVCPSFNSFGKWIREVNYINRLPNSKGLKILIPIIILTLISPYRKMISKNFIVINLMLLSVVLYYLIITTFGAIGEYFRLMMPVGTIIQYFCFFLPVYLLFNFINSIIKTFIVKMVKNTNNKKYSH